MKKVLEAVSVFRDACPPAAILFIAVFGTIFGTVFGFLVAQIVGLFKDLH